MDETGLFIDLGILFLAALGGAALAQLLRQPLIVGYVLAGIVVGPFTAGPTIEDSHFVSLFAEVWVADDSYRNLIFIEQAVSLGRFGALTFLFPEIQNVLRSRGSRRPVRRWERC